MNGCPDCDARRKAEEARVLAAKQFEDERRQSDVRSNNYLIGMMGGGLMLGLPAAWIHDWLGGPSFVMPAMFVGIALGVSWVYWRGDKFGTMKP